MMFDGIPLKLIKIKSCQGWREGIVHIGSFSTMINLMGIGDSNAELFVVYFEIIPLGET